MTRKSGHTGFLVDTLQPDGSRHSVVASDGLRIASARSRADSRLTFEFQSGGSSHANETRSELDGFEGPRVDALIDLLPADAPVLREFRDGDVAGLMRSKLPD